MTAPSPPADYRFFDADNDYYEPLDMFTRYIDPAFADRTFVVEERDGETVVLFEARPLGSIGGARVDLIGVERVLFGSDFPHAEGMSAESDYRDRASELVAKLGRTDEETCMIMRGNGMRLLGLVDGPP